MHSVKQFPGPPNWGILGTMPDFVQRLKKFDGFAPKAFESYFHDYKTDTISMRLATLPMVVTRDIEYIKKIAKNDPEHYLKPQGNFLSNDLFGESILFSEGSKWKSKRTLYRNAFKKSSLESFLPIMHQGAKELEVVWSDVSERNETHDLASTLGRFSMDIIGRAGFGFDFKAQEKPEESEIWKDIHTLLAAVVTQTQSALGLLIPIRMYTHITPTGLNYKAAKIRVTNVMDRLLNSSSENKKNIIYYLREAAKEEGNLKITTEELREEIFLFFQGGHETSTAALAWCLFYLSQNPHVVERARAEIEEKIGKSEEVPDWATINSLPYLQQIMKETLRIRPVSGIIARTNIEDDEHQGIKIKKGTIISIANYANHHNPKHWENPDVFDPDRFSSEKSENRDQYTWLPFGIGPRNCIGMQFAMLEARILLSYILPRFDLICVKPPKMVEKITTRPVGGLFKIKRR